MNDPKGGVAKVTCPTFEAMGQIPAFHRTYFLLVLLPSVSPFDIDGIGELVNSSGLRFFSDQDALTEQCWDFMYNLLLCELLIFIHWFSICVSVADIESSSSNVTPEKLQTKRYVTQQLRIVLTVSS